MRALDCAPEMDGGAIGRIECTVTVIKRIRILASTRAEAKRVEACVAVQVFRGIGLVLPERMDFEQIWNLDRDGLDRLTDIRFRAFLSGLRVMSGVHLCADIKPGMRRDAVVEILRKTSCINDVVPSNAQ